MEYGYDNALRLTSLNVYANDAIENAYSYKYDLNGNQKEKTDNGTTSFYRYDDLGRLLISNEPDAITNYTFDMNGNIQTKTINHQQPYEFNFKKNGADYSISNIAVHNYTYAYDANNRLKFEGEYIGGVGDKYSGLLEIEKYNTYDNNGNLLSKKTTGQVDENVLNYNYNKFNQLVSYTGNGITAEYTYNPDGMRNSKTVNGVTTKFYWDRGFISNEAENGTWTVSNTVGIDGIFARDDSNGMRHMLKNGHGDVIKLTQNGIVTVDYEDYSPYGINKKAVEDTNPFRYCGEYYDNETDLIYLRNLYYDSVI